MYPVEILPMTLFEVLNWVQENVGNRVFTTSEVAAGLGKPEYCNVFCRRLRILSSLGFIKQDGEYWEVNRYDS